MLYLFEWLNLCIKIARRVAKVAKMPLGESTYKIVYKK